jgi:hypothetical protein
MDGTTADYIVIPIVAVICLATWLAAIYWADAHPRKAPRAAAGQAGAAGATAGQVKQVKQVTVPRQAAAPAEDQDRERGQAPAGAARRGTR